MAIKNLMQNFFSVLLILSTLAVVSGCVTAKQKKLDMGINPLTDQELQMLFSKSLEGDYVSSSGKTAMVSYSPDGKQKIISPRITDEGTWTIANGEQCSKWKQIRKGAERCSTWFDVGNGKYDVYNPDGSKNGVMTFK